MGKWFIVFLCAVLGTVCVISCEKNIGKGLYVPADFDNSFSNEWAVIIEPYVKYMREPSDTAEVNSYARKTDIISVEARRIVGDTNETVTWYKFEGGWVQEKFVKIFSNRAKAETAAKTLQ